jgi:4-amino-4-deoxychorismate lyase
VIDCLIDGVAAQDVSADDRGLAYGHGVFETIEIAAGELPHWARHWRRLVLGCSRLGLAEPGEALLRGEAMRLARGHERAVLKLMLTAGSAGVGYRLPDGAPTRRVLCMRTWPERRLPTEGAALRLCRTRLPFDPALAGIKHLNRLHSVLARAEWRDEYAEGLLCDPDGCVVEGTMSNVFWVEGDTLLTPDLSRCGVAGIMRERILEWADGRGATARIEACPPERLRSADAVFVCNSLIGIWPAARLDRHLLLRAGLIEELLSAVRAGEC